MMATRKKGSRQIDVDGVSYRWRIRKRLTYGQECFPGGMLHVAIELAENPGQLLWINSNHSHLKRYDTEQAAPVTPALLARWIQQAIALGWKPEVNGPTLKYDASDSELRRAVR